jgi:hypothetical protein
MTRGFPPTLKKSRYFLAALLGAGVVTFLFAVLRGRRQITTHVPPIPPEGGEREGEFELFIGS